MSDMTPTPEDLARDAAVDMAWCNAATPGPWSWRYLPDQDRRQYYMGHARLCGHPANLRVCTIDTATSEDGEFLCRSRTALPAWIRRAIAAEMELAGAKKALALMNAGMESQCELMDSMKQQLRMAEAEVARLKQAIADLRTHYEDEPDYCE